MIYANTIRKRKIVFGKLKNFLTKIIKFNFLIIINI